MSVNDGLLLNIAEFCSSTRALGPGLRAAVWVQGCPIGCKNCIAPDWIPFKKAYLLTPQEAGDRLLQNPDIEGITISGGEPMMQAEGLTAMVRFIRERRRINVICFTGFRYEALLKWDQAKKIHGFLREIDVLVDGPYIEALNNGLTFAGSSNQRVLELSHEKVLSNRKWTPRQMEIHLRDRNILYVGVPPKNWHKEHSLLMGNPIGPLRSEAK